MAKKKAAAAPAEASEAIRKLKPPPEGIPPELWEEWRIKETFEPGLNGEPSPEEQAAVDAQAEKIRAFRKEQRRPAEEAEKAEVAAKEKRAAEKRQAQIDMAATVRDLVARVELLEKANG